MSYSGSRRAGNGGKCSRGPLEKKDTATRISPQASMIHTVAPVPVDDIQMLFLENQYSVVTGTNVGNRHGGIRAVSEAMIGDFHYTPASWGSTELSIESMEFCVINLIIVAIRVRMRLVLICMR